MRSWAAFQLGFQPAVAAKEPFVIDEGIDEGALGGGGGSVLGCEGGLEDMEMLDVFPSDEHAVGVEAGLRALRRRGLALGERGPVDLRRWPGWQRAVFRKGSSFPDVARRQAVLRNSDL